MDKDYFQSRHVFNHPESSDQIVPGIGLDMDFLNTFYGLDNYFLGKDAKEVSKIKTDDVEANCYHLPSRNLIASVTMVKTESLEGKTRFGKRVILNMGSPHPLTDIIQIIEAKYPNLKSAQNNSPSQLPTTQNKEGLAIIHHLAEMIGVNLYDCRLSIATPRESAKVMMYDSSLKAEIIPTQRGRIKIEASRGPVINIELVDPSKDRAPVGAIYEITAYNSAIGNSLNGDVYSVHIGWQGIQLDDAAREMAKKLR